MQDNLIETVEIKSYEQSKEQFIDKLKNSFLYDVEKINKDEKKNFNKRIWITQNGEKATINHKYQ